MSLQWSGGASGLLQGSEVFEGSSPIAAGQVLVELICEGLQAVTIGGAGAEAEGVQARCVWQVDGEGLWQHQELIFLRGLGGQARSLPGLGNGEQVYPVASKSQSQSQGPRADGFCPTEGQN